MHNRWFWMFDFTSWVLRRVNPFGCWPNHIFTDSPTPVDDVALLANHKQPKEKALNLWSSHLYTQLHIWLFPFHIIYCSLFLLSVNCQKRICMLLETNGICILQSEWIPRHFPPSLHTNYFVIVFVSVFLTLYLYLYFICSVFVFLKHSGWVPLVISLLFPQSHS